MEEFGLTAGAKEKEVGSGERKKCMHANLSIESDLSAKFTSDRHRLLFVSEDPKPADADDAIIEGC